MLDNTLQPVKFEGILCAKNHHLPQESLTALKNQQTEGLNSTLYEL